MKNLFTYISIHFIQFHLAELILENDHQAPAMYQTGYWRYQKVITLCEEIVFSLIRVKGDSYSVSTRRKCSNGEGQQTLQT